MNLRNLVALALFALASTATAWSQESDVNPKKLAATVDGWRQAPVELMALCDREGAPGSDDCHARVQQWAAKYNSEIERIDRELPLSIAAIVGQSTVSDPSRAIRAGLAMRRANAWTSGRSHEELLELCANAFKVEFPVWSSERADQADRDMTQLVEWRTRHQ